MEDVKPPIGTAPAYIIIDRRIRVLAEAIARTAEWDGNSNRYDSIAEWAEEIAGHCATMKRLKERC